MTRYTKTLAATLIAAAAAIGGCGGAGEKTVEANPGMMMAKMQELGTPGANHEFLARFAGTWASEAKFWMDAEQKEPDVSRGTMTVKPIHNGRYIAGDYKGSFNMPGPDGKMMEHQFNGHMLRGYSNADAEFQSVWIDSESTTVLWSTGKGDGKAIHSTGTAKGPDLAGNIVDQKMWETFTMVNDNKWVQEMWGQCGSGPKFKNMEITYTRTGR